MATVRGGVVLPHVQAFADAVSRATGAESFGTYPDHDPTMDRALDIFVPPDDATLGNAIAAFAIEHLDKYGVDYIIFRQRIYNPEIATYWRQMERRGSATVFDLIQNHYNHVHISFEATGSVDPVEEVDDMADPAVLEQLVAINDILGERIDNGKLNQMIEGQGRIIELLEKIADKK